MGSFLVNRIALGFEKENFMKDVSFISDFILRGTYGTTGSQGFDPYQAHGYYTYSNLLLPYYSSDATGSEILAMHNESLKWQTTKSTNLALELGFSISVLLHVWNIIGK